MDGCLGAAISQAVVSGIVKLYILLFSLFVLLLFLLLAMRYQILLTGQSFCPAGEERHWKNPSQPMGKPDSRSSETGSIANRHE